MDTVLNVLRVIGLIILVLMVFNLMILVHEWGHFLAARWRGLKVEKFYVWFGKAIWKKTYNGVEYGLGSIPLGGFVALPQMAPMEAIEGKNDEPRETLPPITPLDKIIVAFAGPLFSFLLAVLFAFIVWSPWVGKPVFTAETETRIGYVAKGSAAEEAGIKVGDKILSIDGKPVRGFGGMVDSVTWHVISSKKEKIEFKVQRPGVAEPMVFAVTPRLSEEEVKRVAEMSWWKRIFSRPGFRRAGIGGADTLLVEGFIKEESHTPGQEGGLKKGDILVNAGGKTIYSRTELAQVLGDQIGKPLELEVSRRDTPESEPRLEKLTVTPRPPDQRAKDWVAYAPNDDPEKVIDNRFETLGVRWDPRGERKLEYPEPGPLLWDASRMIVDTLSALTSSSDVKLSHLSSAVGIGHVYFNLLQDPEGWRRVLWFSVVLNVNLALLNLLPLPVLDGGHITMALLEWIRRRPINMRVLEVVQAACVFLLLGLMGFLILKDLGGIFGVDEAKDETPAKAPVESKFLSPTQRTAAP